MNSRSFEDNESSMHDFKLFFFRTLLDWLSLELFWIGCQPQGISLFPIIDLLDLCNFCN